MFYWTRSINSVRYRHSPKYYQKIRGSILAQLKLSPVSFCSMFTAVIVVNITAVVSMTTTVVVIWIPVTIVKEFPKAEFREPQCLLTR